MSNQGDDSTSEQYQYFLQHASDSRAAGMLICTAITVFFSTFFILLRLVGRRLTHQRWYVNISDCFVIVSWVGNYSSLIPMLERILTETPCPPGFRRGFRDQLGVVYQVWRWAAYHIRHKQEGRSSRRSLERI